MHTVALDGMGKGKKEARILCHVCGFDIFRDFLDYIALVFDFE